jgi:hypothetical protein
MFYSVKNPGQTAAVFLIPFNWNYSLLINFLLSMFPGKKKSRQRARKKYGKRNERSQ